MSARALLRLYPVAWRERYGEELEGLIVEASGGGRVPWRMRADVASSGVRERLRTAGLGGDGAPGDRARGGALLVLCAWALFVLAGAAVQKISEHWQDALPAGHSLPSIAFTGLVVVASGTSVLVAGGIAVTVPSLVSFLRAGGWPAIRGRIRAAVAATVLALAATAALVIWLHAAGDPARGAAYAAGAVWAVMLAACLGLWTAGAVATARRLRLAPATLELEARLATGVTVAMGAMTAATAAWWAALASRAPGFLGTAPPALIAAVAAMTLATLAGAAGSRGALRALPALRD
jgi:hypothetical protein